MILKGSPVLSKVKEFVSYIVFDTYPFVEYIADAFLNWSLTRKITNIDSNTDIREERLKLFITVTVRSCLYIFATSLIYSKLIEPLAVALFNDCNLPIWIYPFCLFAAWRSLNKICDDFS